MALALAFAMACSSTDREWDEAERAGTAESYTRFIEAHPDHYYATIARIRIEMAKEDGDWERAVARNSREGYEAFLQSWPQGQYGARAIAGVESLTTSTVRLSMPRRATLSGTVWISGDTLIAREAGTGRSLRLRKYMIARIEIDWAYEESPVIFSLDPTADSTAALPVLNRLAATPAAMRIHLRDGTSVAVDPATVRPRRLELDTRQTVLGSSREGDTTRVHLRLAPFRQMYAPRVLLADSLRLAPEEIRFGPDE
ncbi:MAG: hypothetical protein OEO21_04400 [Candidatus Krumholzibacteria bacterium]|nr:hypothetical protein [Candidatus Krumholzibacteria bacterium]